MAASKSIAVLAGAAVAAAVLAGLYLSGPPSAERARRLDERRVEDLGVLAAAIDAYFSASGSLPPGLDELRDARRLTQVPTDPESGESYRYEPLEPARYRLCATFAAATPADQRSGFWGHDRGPQCFEITPRPAPLELPAR